MHKMYDISLVVHYHNTPTLGPGLFEDKYPENFDLEETAWNSRFGTFFGGICYMYAAKPDHLILHWKTLVNFLGAEQICTEISYNSI